MKRGMNSNEMQKNNRLLALRTLVEEGSMTRTELALRTNLQKATITNIINEFYDLGIVGVDGDLASGRRGEKISVRLEDVYILSMGITRKDYFLGLFTLYGTKVRDVLHRFEKNEDIFESAKRMAADARRLQDEVGANRILGVCLGVPGLFINRPELGEEIFMVSEFEGLSQVNLKAELEAALGRKIFIKHDAKLSAYGEWHCAEETRGNERASIAVVRSRGFGIGCGFVVNGKIMNGHMGLAGEVGYMGINYNGHRPGNERGGSFEYSAGTESTTRYIKQRLTEFPDSPLTEDSSYEDILEAYEHGDALAAWAVEKMAWMLGYGLADLIYVVNPDCIIIGPDYPDTEHFISKVREAIREFVPAYVEECTTIRYSLLKEDSFLLGGYFYTFETLCDRGNIFDLIRKAKGLEGKS